VGSTAPTSGRILLDGRPIAGPGRDRGIVFQQYALFPWRTAAENIEFGSTSPGSSQSSGATSRGISLTWSACPVSPTAIRTNSLAA